MSELHIECRLGTHLSAGSRAGAAELLSWAYTRWQENPRNTDPVKTDTSPPVYEKMLLRGIREVVLVHDRKGEDVDGEAPGSGGLVGVFVHSLSPFYDQYPLRKLSFLGVRPRQRGFEALQALFARYAAFMAEKGEDVCITSDLDQETLNALLMQAGFREVEERNETYFVLSQLLARKVISSQKVHGDFVVDEIITIDGKAVRRNKKLLLLQTTPLNFYRVYKNQQRARLERSLPEANRERLAEALSHADEGIFFISDYEETISQPDPAKGGFDSQTAIWGAMPEDRPGLLDGQGRAWLLPPDEAAMRAVAGKVVLRPGFFDFLCYCYKILGSYCLTTGATPQEVRAVLARRPHPDIRLTFDQMVEQVLTPDVAMGQRRRPGPDGLERTPYTFSGPYVEHGPGPNGKPGLRILKDKMVETLLGLRGASAAPVVYLGSRAFEPSGVARLFRESVEQGLTVLVLDFGQELTLWIQRELFQGRPQDFPGFSVVNLRDFYQVPVMLECLGLPTERGIEFAVG